MKLWLALTIALFVSNPGDLFAEAPTSQLQIVILDGEGALNNIKQQTAREPIVQVNDENHKPVAGALVIFTLPQSGPSATFADGSTVFQAETDSAGRVASSALTPNKIVGKYQIQVEARYQGLSAKAQVNQSNYMGSNISAAHAAGHAAFPVKIVLVVVAAVGVGTAAAVLATRGSSSSGATITPGTGTVTAPSLRRH